MSLKKTVAILAAAGALAAISVPAMALENEFHGSYAFSTIFSNFQAGTSGDFNPAFRGTAAVAAVPAVTHTFIDSVTGLPVSVITTPAVPGVAATKGYGHKRQMNNYFEQRARLQYTAKVSDDLKLVTHFEIDNRFGAGRTAGAGDLDSDYLNFEVKHMYLDFNLGKSFNVKTGLQAYNDTIKGLFISADVPAIMTTTKLGAYTLGVGFSRFDDDGTANLDGSSRLGDKNKDLFILDNTFAITKDTKVALSYYFLADYAAGSTGGIASAQGPLNLTNADDALLLHTLGLSGESKIGPLTLSGFAAAQAGHQKNFVAPGKNRYFHGYAANLGAKVAVGPGTAKTAFLFTSGNNSTNPAHYKGWVTSSVNTYNEGGMMILVRNQINSPSTTDTYLRRNVTNIALLTFGYDANLTDKVFLNGNLGAAWAPASNKGSVLNPNRNNGDYLGTELNLEAGYKVNASLTLRAQAAYALLGSYYNSATFDAAGRIANPENPYTGRLLASFKF